MMTSSKITIVKDDEFVNARLTGGERALRAPRIDKFVILHDGNF